MASVEPIPDEDAIHRQIDFPRMYNDVREMIWDSIFMFPRGEPESVIWGKYAPRPDDIHRLGLEREAKTRQRDADMRYVGFISSIAGAIRAITTRPGHGFSVVHKPDEGISHAEISYKAGDGRTVAQLKRGEKSELKLALRNVFGALVSYSRA